MSINTKLLIRDGLEDTYPDIYTSDAVAAIEVLSRFNQGQKEVMAKRITRRIERTRNKERITFLNPEDRIPRTDIKVQDARDGKFEGPEIPHDLQRQWIQGTGPAAKPNSPIEKSIRNVAYALLSGADGSSDVLRSARITPLESYPRVDRHPYLRRSSELISRRAYE